MRMFRPVGATFSLITLFWLTAVGHAQIKAPEARAYARPEYVAIKHWLARGWNTWNAARF